MNIVVLLSAGRHPVSGLDCPVPVELQAIALGLGLGRVMGLHAGPGAAVAACLGHGLPALTALDLPAESDPLPALVAALTGMAPDLVLAGRRGQGGDDTGWLPYRVAAALGWPILADAIAIMPGAGAGAGAVTVDQALPRGVRRRVAVPVPAVVTIHPAAPPALPFAEGRRRRGVWTRREGGALVDVAATPVEERPYRQRPRLIGEAAAAASRLVADPTPTEAAGEILAFLRGIGMG